MSTEERKKNIQIIKELYPPNSRFPETAKQGEEFMIWALKRFIERMGGWENLNDEILKDMAYYCERHEKMTNNIIDKI